jgi:DNA-binding MarR family transcriptional regulator
MKEPKERKVSFDVTYEEGERPIFFRMPKKYLGKDYLFVYQDFLLEIAQDKELNHTDTRIILAILSKVHYENEFSLSQADLGNLLQVAPSNISKSMLKLESKGYLFVLKTIGRQKIYMLNPYGAFRGRAKNWKELCEKWDKQELRDLMESAQAS